MGAGAPMANAPSKENRATTRAISPGGGTNPTRGGRRNSNAPAGAVNIWREVLHQKRFRTGLKNEVGRHDHVLLTQTPPLRQGPACKAGRHAVPARRGEGPTVPPASDAAGWRSAEGPGASRGVRGVTPPGGDAGQACVLAPQLRNGLQGRGAQGRGRRPRAHAQWAGASFQAP